MARYILIDSNSGYVWGDTGDLDGAARDETPIEAARRLDESLGETGREYAEAPRHEIEQTTASGYLVYRADIGGSEAVAICQDGQDQEYIEAVERECAFVTAIRVADREHRRGRRRGRQGRWGG